MSTLWDTLSAYIEGSRNPAVVFPSAADCASDVEALCFKAGSTPETVILNTSGIIISDFIRILGGSSDKRRSLRSYNEQVAKKTGKNSLLIIGDDIVGGIYAIDLGLFGNPGSVYFFQPDCLQWMDTKKDYTSFLAWALNGDLQQFYGRLWSQGSAVPFDAAILYYPFVWSKEFDINTAASKQVPAQELLEMNWCVELCKDDAD